MAKLFTKNGDEYEEVEAFTQDEVNDIVGKRVEREREKFADYDDLKSKAGSVDTIKSEYEEKLQESNTAVEDLKKQLGAQKLETDKVKIMSEFKLPDDMAEFVTGDTPDEMRTRAEKLSKRAPGSPIPSNKDKKPDADKAKDSKAIAGKLFGTGKSDE